MKVTAEKNSPKGSARNANLKRDVELQGIDFGPVAGHLAHYMRRLLKSFKYHFKTSVVDLDVQASDVGALFVIGLNPGLSPSQLAPAVSLEPAQVTGMLNSFELKGWIARRVSSADGRSRSLHLTRVGEKLVAQLRPIVVEADRTFVEGILTKQETQQLTTLLAKLLAGRQA
jgi:MarR family transcriptional regulator, temperature-dependent positive regulator of motility